MTSPLDPTLAEDITRLSNEAHTLQDALDLKKWEIAQRVNDMWDEHENLPFDSFADGKLFETKQDYYAECSRVANGERKKKMFGESGETMRLWCELETTYGVKGKQYLEVVFLDHLREAKRLYRKGKCLSPTDAIDRAIKESWSVDDMVRHYDPPQIAHESEIANAKISSLLTLTWQWMKSADNRAEMKKLSKRMNEILESEVEK